MSDSPALGSRPLRVFLCHSRGDKAAVRALYERLQDDGFLPWLDEEHLIPGQDWQVEIPKAVRAADLVLVCLSSHSISKEGYIQKEIKFALDAADEKPEGTIYLIPLKLEECSVPERLGRWQWVDFFHPNGYTRLLKALRVRGQSLGLTVVPPAPAPARSTAVAPGTAQVNAKDGMEYVWIPPGQFTMGATAADENPRDGEKPAHPVRISKGFWLGKTPVTVAAYNRFVQATGRGMPAPPGFNAKWKDEDHPIVNVSWNDAQAFCGWADGRLPTEAEWEYAARGGKEGFQYPWGNDIGPDRANYESKGTTPVLKFPAQNVWGLRDMSGNVWEWVADWYDEKYYSTLPSDKAAEDPRGPVIGKSRVVRGGAWSTYSWFLRAAFRFRYEPEYCNDFIGFRCAREVISP